MSQPLGFVNSKKPRYVCKIKKAFYELEKDFRAWFKKLSSYLHKWGFETFNADTSMMVFRQDNDMVIFLIYVDNILMIGSNPTLIQQMITDLHQLFVLKDLMSLMFFLGLEVDRIVDEFHFSQCKYIQQLLDKAQLQDSKSVAAPMSTTIAFSKYDGDFLENPTLYRTLVEAL